MKSTLLIFAILTLANAASANDTGCTAKSIIDYKKDTSIELTRSEQASSNLDNVVFQVDANSPFAKQFSAEVHVSSDYNISYTLSDIKSKTAAGGDISFDSKGRAQMSLSVKRGAHTLSYLVFCQKN